MINNMPSVRNLKSKFETQTTSNVVPQLQNSNFLTVPQPETNADHSDLGKLKAMTERLNLTTKRPSYIEWQAMYLGTPNIVKSLQRGLPAVPEERQNLPWTQERQEEIGEAITWIRNELMEMRNCDQELARTLVTLRHDIHELKLQFSCEAHRMVLNDVEDDLEEEDLLNELSDCPLGIGPLSPLAPLQKFGVTKMNIERRRYSLC